MSLTKNTLNSVLSLFFQSGYTAILGLVTNIVISAIEAKEVFGVYAATLAVIGIFNYFADIGLAAALIQKKEIEHGDLKTVFTIQQLLVVTLITIGFLFTNFVTTYYKLPPGAQLLYWSILLSFFISSLKTIPSVILERELQYQQIVKVQIIENTLFYIIVSALIIAGLGLTSFTVAVLARSLIGTVLLYRFKSWDIALGISRKSMHSLLSFGLPFQFNSILALIKDDFLIIFLGRTLGLATLGEITWAKKWAEAPIRIIMDNISKVLFPLLSRIQDDRERLNKTVSVTIWVQTIIILPAILLSFVTIPILTEVLPAYHKWQSAIPVFRVLCISAFLSTLSTPFTNIFNALKKPLVPLIFMIYWTTLTWVLTPILIKPFGALGFGYVQVILSSSFIVLIILARQMLGITLSTKHLDYKQLQSFAHTALVKFRLKKDPSPTTIDPELQ